MCQDYKVLNKASIYMYLKVEMYKSLVGWSLHKYKCLWGVGCRAEVQVFKKKVHTHIHLDYTRIEFLSCIKNI